MNKLNNSRLPATKYVCLLVCSQLFFLLNRNICLAQSNFYEEPNRTFYAGLIAGINLSTIDNIDYPRYSKVGLNSGGIVYAKFTKQIAASMEILYSQKGVNINAPTLSNIHGEAIASNHTNLNYAEVPVMINYFDEKVGIFGVGISYSRLATSSEDLVVYPTMSMTNYPFNSQDIEGIIGGDLRLWQGLFLSVRFQYSLTQIRDKVPPVFTLQEEHNNLWVFRFMYLFK